MRTDDPLIEDTLFLACTRPATVASAPMEAVDLNLIISATLFLAAHNLTYLLVAPVLHLVFREICRQDPNAFRVLWMFLQTKGRCRTPRLWGGSSMTPLILKRRYRLEELQRG